ncbi:hypothetical protein CYMTET_27770 [Cymbomonas tetramitiformis]|uniref:Cyclin n=1 Tax=Cymbomonas tetramitiformis TaxID=36881 RepID=A0AAE0FP19_9CHLO|nr:hypothetical protein CYMTET_27770 [Cymbomonas tetramitiformis]
MTFERQEERYNLLPSDRCDETNSQHLLILLEPKPVSLQGSRGDVCDTLPDAAGNHRELLDALGFALEELSTSSATQAKTVQESSEPRCDIAKKLQLFEGVRVPVIPVRDYAERLLAHCKASPVCLIMAYIYISRICKCCNDFVLTPLSMHRLLLVCTMVAAKFCDDRHYSNALYSKVGGVEVKELNHLELTVLSVLGFRMCVKPSELEGCGMYFTTLLQKGAASCP